MSRVEGQEGSEEELGEDKENFGKIKTFCFVL